MYLRIMDFIWKIHICIGIFGYLFFKRSNINLLPSIVNEVAWKWYPDAVN